MTSVHEIKDRLLRVIDKDGSVLNLPAVMEIVIILENTSITKDELEETRIGKYINDVRRAAKDPSLQKRAKKLIKTWQQMISSSMQASRNLTHRSANDLVALQRQSTAYDAKDNIRSSPISNLNGSAQLSSSSNRKQLTKIVEEISRKEKKTYKKETKTTNRKEDKLTNRKEEKSTNRKEEKTNFKTKLPKPKSAPNLSESNQSSFICKPNGLKMTITTLPSSTVTNQNVSWQLPDENQRLKRKRKGGNDEKEIAIANRTSKLNLSDAPKARTFSPRKPDDTAKSSNVDNNNTYSETYWSSSSSKTSAVGNKPSTSQQSRSEPAVVLVETGELGNRILSPSLSYKIGEENAGVEGCRSNDGTWYTWADSFVLKRTYSEPVTAEPTDEPDLLSILPYVELD